MKTIASLMLIFAALCSGALAGTEFEENGHYTYHDLANWNCSSAGLMVDSMENQTVALKFSDGTTENIPIVIARKNAATSLEFDVDMLNHSVEILMVTPTCCCESKYDSLMHKDGISWVEVSGINLSGRIYSSYGKPFDTQERYIFVDGIGTLRLSIYGPGEATRMDGLAPMGVLKNALALDLTPLHHIL